jgi:hypothetical protein
MIINKVLIAAAAFALTATAVPAFAHDDDYDHSQHYQLHDQLRDAHRRAHEEGFYSEAEHRAYHRALRDIHEDFHEDHPGNWHDHYGYGFRRWWGGYRY